MIDGSITGSRLCHKRRGQKQSCLCTFYYQLPVALYKPLRHARISQGRLGWDYHKKLYSGNDGQFRSEPMCMLVNSVNPVIISGMQTVGYIQADIYNAHCT